MKKQLLAGGLALALLAGCGSDTDPKALPVLTTGAGADDATAMAAPESGASTADMRIGGRVEYRYDGELPELDDEAAAWELAVERADTAEIEDLAERLGIEGEVERTEFGWHVDGDDGAQLDVQRAAGLPWNSYVASPGDDVAVSSGVACPEDSQTRAMCVVEEPQRPADLPSKAEAEDIARALLEELGVDLEGATVRVEDGFSVWNVMADPELDGMPVIGMTTAVAVGPKGVVQFANGWLTEPDQGDDYPLIGTEEALEKLQDEQVTTMMGAPEPMIAECEGGPATDCMVDPVPVDQEPTVVELTDVRLGLQLFGSWDADEPAYLVPSYLFATEDGGELPVIGIEEEFLVPPTEPAPAPEPGGSGGGSSGSGGGSGSCAGAAAAAEAGAEPSDAGSIEACGPGQVAPGEVATFSVKASCGDSVVVDFGDGTPEDTVPMGEVSHRYEEAGSYEVAFRATACEASVSMTLTVGDAPTATTAETPVQSEAPPRPGA